MKTLLTLITLIIALSTIAQSKCDRHTLFTADFNMQVNAQVNRVNASLNIGSNGISNVDNNYRSWGLTIGSKMYDEAVVNKAGHISYDTRLTPVTTLSVNYRGDGYYNTVIHSIAITAGLNKYTEYSYRMCANTNPNSFATVGFVASYNTKQGFTAGFILLGLF